MDINARREAAKALRAIKRGGEGWYSLSDAVMGKPAPRDEVVARLADLIDPGEDVSMSAYDLLSEEDREAAEWVRKHNGIEYVKAHWEGRVARSHIEHMAERQRERRERMQRHIEYVQRLCRERRERIGELNREIADMRPRLMPEGCETHGVIGTMLEYRRVLNGVCRRLGLTDGTGMPEQDGVIYGELEKRLMPEGYEWPRYESGEPVPIGGEFMGKDGKTYTAKQIQFIGKCFSLYDFCDRKPQFSGFYGECVKRPAVLAADGEPLEAGQTVYVIANGKTHHVTETDTVSKRFRSMEQVDGSHWLDPMCFTHQCPVLDADGVPCKKGDTVYALCDGSEHVVECVNENGTLKSAKPNSACYLVASRCTHTKPEPPDTWERIEEDAKLAPGDYIEKHGRKTDLYAYEEMPIDLVRRCKALAERDE